MIICRCFLIILLIELGCSKWSPERIRRLLSESSIPIEHNSRVIVKSLQPPPSSLASSSLSVILFNYYIIYHEDHQAFIYQFPDSLTYTETLRMLGTNDSDISMVPSSLIPDLYPPIDLLPSLTKANHNYYAILAFIMERNHFFQNAHFSLIADRWNPAITTDWPTTIKNKKNSEEHSFLMAWRQKGVIGFTKLVVENQTREVQLQELTPSAKIPLDGNRHEDPRLLILHDQRLLIAFTSVLPPIKGIRRIPHACQSFTFATFLPEKNTIQIDQTILFDQDFGGWQKNWVPFEYHQNLYFIHTIYPTRIFQYLNKYTNNQTANYQELPPLLHSLKLPWKEEYGLIRGGSPAIRLPAPYPDVYLMFFHSVYAYHDYYMGAMTFCAKPPFHLHAMSAVPIVNLQFYAGQRLSRKVSYVVFPTNFVFLNQQKDILLSFGHQDRHGYLARFPLQSLLNSLTIIQSCE